MGAGNGDGRLRHPHTYSGAHQVLRGARCGWETDAERRELVCLNGRWDNPYIVTGGDVGKKFQEAETCVFSDKVGGERIWHCDR